MKKIELSACHPIADIRANGVVANNGTVALCYESILPEIYSLSETDFEDIHGTWFQALKSLPIGCVVHKQDVYVKRTYTGESLPDKTFLAKATHGHFKEREYMDHRCFLLFIFTGNKALNNPKYVNPCRKVPKDLPLELDE